MRKETLEESMESEEYKEFMRMESESFDWNNLPEDVSLDFAMSEKNLYLVFYETTKDMYLINKNEGPVQIHYVLASENEKHAQQEIYETHKKANILFSIKFEDFAKVLNKFNKKESFFSLFPKNIYYVKKDNQEYWSDKKEGDVLLKGNISDLKKVYGEISEILNTENYIKVYDYRPDQHGHPEDWLFFMQSPSTALNMRKIKKEFKDGLFNE